MEENEYVFIDKSFNLNLGEIDSVGKRTIDIKLYWEWNKMSRVIYEIYLLWWWKR